MQEGWEEEMPQEVQARVRESTDTRLFRCRAFNRWSSSYIHDFD